MATVASVSNKPSTRVQWMWNSNANPFSKSQKVEWRRYSDVETMIIEKAFTADESCAMLDEYHIDFKHNLQISNNDTGKQRPVERVMWDKDDKVLREERFLPNPVAPDLPFGGQYGFISPFIKEVVKDLNLTKKQSPSKDNTVVLIIVEKAALEKQEFACNGRRCATCGECREWYFTGDLGSWKWIHSVKDWGGDNTARWFNHYLFTRFKNRDDAKCVESDESELVTSNSEQTSSDQSTLLSRCFVKKKFLWIIIGIIIVILVVTIPTVIIKTKKTNKINLSAMTAETTNMIESSTTTEEITTQQQFITTTHNPTTEVSIEPKCDKWKQHGITVAGGNGQGDQLNQFSFPCAIYIDDNKSILIADTGNHRIVEWKYNAKEGQTIAGGNGQGNSLDQLYMPLDIAVDKEKNAIIVCDMGNARVMRWLRQSQTNPQTLISDISCGGVAIDKNGYIYVSDASKSVVRRWKEGDTDGTLVAGGNGRGKLQNQFNNPGKIFVDEEYSVYVVDINNHRIMKWKKDAEEGIMVAGGNEGGNGLNQLYQPFAVIVDNLGLIYIAVPFSHRIMQWREGDAQGSIVAGGNGEGHEPNQLLLPKGVSFDNEGDLFVVDSQNHRIQKYEPCTE
ncbi:unnamed protein product [Adineta steineri]|uniref:WWE domain-containing protein n=1 Tax=Adineta steineri TaxID=433720 RepID=A0A815JD41_9BILA|nr:unnamed protein product [Adineta steineri]